MNRAQRREAEREQKRQQLKWPSGPEVHVRIGVPSGIQWYAAFAMSLLRMQDNTMEFPTPGYGKVQTSVHNSVGSTIWTQRSKLMQQAIEDGCTHLLFVDCDQTFPAFTLRKLLSHKKEVVACNVAVKQIPSCPTARYKPKNGNPPVPVFTKPDSKGLEEVWRIGTGVMLIDLSIVPRLKEPWFKVSWGDEEAQYGEDWWFCERVEEAGIPIYIDHDLSWEVGHLGLMEYQHFHIPKELIITTEQMAREETADPWGAAREAHDKAMMERANGA